MAESHSLALIASEQTPKMLAIGDGGERWEVEFSRFFNYPPMTSMCPDLVPLSSKVRNRRPSGTWISSSSHVLLQLLRHPSNSDDVILRICFRDTIMVTLSSSIYSTTFFLALIGLLFFFFFDFFFVQFMLCLDLMELFRLLIPFVF